MFKLKGQAWQKWLRVGCLSCGCANVETNTIFWYPIVILLWTKYIFYLGHYKTYLIFRKLEWTHRFGKCLIASSALHSVLKVWLLRCCLGRICQNKQFVLDSVLTYRKTFSYIFYDNFHYIPNISNLVNKLFKHNFPWRSPPIKKLMKISKISTQWKLRWFFGGFHEFF